MKLVNVLKLRVKLWIKLENWNIFFTDWKTKKARENQTQNPTAAGAYSTGNWYHRHNKFLSS